LEHLKKEKSVCRIMVIMYGTGILRLENCNSLLNIKLIAKILSFSRKDFFIGNSLKYNSLAISV
jgi:hypothetical protein